MILVDTSIWIDHLRRQEPMLSVQLELGNVPAHSFVIGELACGNLQNRAQILRLLSGLPHLAEVSHDEVLAFIQDHRLMGRGLGYVDVHLLAATRMATRATLWTRDRRLAEAAASVGLAFPT